MKIYLGSDHAGFEAKEKLRTLFEKQGIRYEDIGAYQFDKDDDYPDFAFKLAEKVAHDKASRGILVCGSGVGVTVAANKVNGIRAVAASDEYSAKMSRIDGDSNVLGLSGRHTPFPKMKKIVLTWLKTEFSNAPRHKRRINKISAYESKR